MPSHGEPWDFICGIQAFQLPKHDFKQPPDFQKGLRRTRGVTSIRVTLIRVTGADLSWRHPKTTLRSSFVQRLNRSSNTYPVPGGVPCGAELVGMASAQNTSRVWGDEAPVRRKSGVTFATRNTNMSRMSAASHRSRMSAVSKLTAVMSLAENVPQAAERDKLRNGCRVQPVVAEQNPCF